MTNPNNALGTNGAFGGRTSVNAFNDNLASYSRGVLSGWQCVPSSGLTVALGGIAGSRDVAVAEDNVGNKTTVNNISGAPVEVTLPDAPTANPRIDSIVAFVDNPPTGSADIVDNYEPVGLVVVSGEVASSPVAPGENAIRSAINSEGISGATAYYVVLANITMTAGITTITDAEISQGSKAVLSASNVDFARHGVVATTFAWQYNDTQMVDVVTNAGTNLSLFLSTGGVRCGSGGDKIIATETRASVVCFGGYLNGVIQANGVAESSTIYTKTVGISGGTTGAYTNNVASGAWYGTAISLDSNNKTMLSLDYRQTKVPSNYQSGDNRWVMDGSFVAGGGNGYGNFLIEYTQGAGQGYYTTALVPRGNQTSTSTTLIYTIYEKV